MTLIYAQPYDLPATGFYFESPEEFSAKANALRNCGGQLTSPYAVMTAGTHRLLRR